MSCLESLVKTENRVKREQEARGDTKQGITDIYGPFMAKVESLFSLI